MDFKVERLTKGRRVGKKCVKKTRANRKRKRCTRVVALKSKFSDSGAAGANSFRFRGRIGNRALSPGSYRLVGRVGGSTKRAKFKIVR